MVRLVILSLNPRVTGIRSVEPSAMSAGISSPRAEREVQRAAPPEST
jgi:hypothetical protein